MYSIRQLSTIIVNLRGHLENDIPMTRGPVTPNSNTKCSVSSRPIFATNGEGRRVYMLFFHDTRNLIKGDVEMGL